jgi:hypothetical protein
MNTTTTMTDATRKSLTTTDMTGGGGGEVDADGGQVRPRGRAAPGRPPPRDARRDER